ncbi:MAG: 50S ribosomal protein L31 [Cyanobium sp. MAG06]|nr:50S ribosomal protein L31 [Cyanobium sp. MAG06]
MKKVIHPKYNENFVVQCICGAKHKMSSTISDFKAEICSFCHPFLSGEDKVLDTANRIARFKARADKKS